MLEKYEETYLDSRINHVAYKIVCELAKENKKDLERYFKMFIEISLMGTSDKIKNDLAISFDRVLNSRLEQLEEKLQRQIDDITS